MDLNADISIWNQLQESWQGWESVWDTAWTLGSATGIMHLLSLTNFLSTDDNRNKRKKKILRNKQIPPSHPFHSAPKITHAMNRGIWSLTSFSSGTIFSLWYWNVNEFIIASIVLKNRINSKKYSDGYPDINTKMITKVSLMPFCYFMF